MSKNFQIRSSYRTRFRWIMEMQLDYERHLHPENQALMRSTASLVREWRGHNMLYDLHIMRSRTADVDFEAEQPWYLSAVWAILSAFYFGI